MLDADTDPNRPTEQRDPFSLDGRHIVVTGGGRGIGRGIALSAARAGAVVTLLARSEAQLKETASTITGSCETAARTCVADLTAEDADDIAERLTADRPVDGIVHAAGVQRRKPALEVTREDWRFVQAVNLEAPFFLSTALVRRQGTSAGPTSHVFVGSLNGTIALPGISPYVASKSGLVGVARALSREWAPDGIRANVVAPGYVHTALTDELFRDPEAEQRIMGRIPAGHLGIPEDIGAAAVFLLGDASRYVTGQVLNVDGGWLAA